MILIWMKYNMKQEKYNSHNQYRKAQKQGYRFKISRNPKGHFAVAEELDFIVKSYEGKNIQGGLCMGVRNGWEVRYLRGKTNSENICGVEIGDIPKKDFGIILQADFHDLIRYWVGNADFVYSNSLDHSFNPRMALGVWEKYLKPGGSMFISWTPWHNEEHTSMKHGDIFGANLDEYTALINQVCNVVGVHEFKKDGLDCFLIRGVKGTL